MARPLAFIDRNTPAWQRATPTVLVVAFSPWIWSQCQDAGYGVGTTLAVFGVLSLVCVGAWVAPRWST